MKLKSWYKVHKWISVVTGVVLLLWLITGVVMIGPGLLPPPAQADQATKPQANFKAITMSPADAITRLEEMLGQPVTVQSVTLSPVGEMLIYRLVLDNGATHLIDTLSGQEVKITEELAREIATADFPTQARILRTERINQGDALTYYGPHPAFRVVFDDAQATYSYVSIKTGEVQSQDRWDRFRVVFGTLHTFQAFKVITGRGRPVIALMVLLSIAAILTALIGYYLALPDRWRLL